MKYNSVLSRRCRVGNLSLSISCRVVEYFFVCMLTFGKLSVGELLYNDCFYHGFLQRNYRNCNSFEKLSDNYNIHLLH